MEVTVPTVHFIPGKSDTAAPQADIQSAETERQRLEQLHREIDEMQRQREKQEAKEARHKALREKKREEEKARKPGAMGPIEDGPSRHRPDRPDLDLGDRGAKLGEEAARRDETDKQAYGDRQGKQDADRKRDKGEEEEETNRIMVRTTTGHLFERIDHLKPTGMSGPKMMAFRQMGEIWKDPKGLYWSNRIQNSDGSVRLLSQPDAKKFCEDRGGRLPWMSEYVNLRHWMGGGSWPELTREYAKGYTPQIFSFFTDRTDVEYPLWVNHTKPAPDSGWGMPRAEYFWFYPFDGFAISGNYTQKEMQENASRNFRGELNKYDTKVWQAAQCVFL